MNALVFTMPGSDSPSFLEFFLPAIPGLVVLVILWGLIRRFSRRVNRHIERTERHQQRVEEALDTLMRGRHE